MLRKLWDRISRKSTLAQPDPWLREALGVEKTFSGVELTPEGSMASSTVTACVRLLSESVASLPLHVYRRGDMGKIRAPEHALYRLLHDRPNAYQTSYTWRAQMMTSVLLFGNSYSLVEKDLDGRIVGLWPLDSRRVTLKAEGGELFYEHRPPRGEKQTFAYGEVLHIKGPSIDGLTGMSVIRLAREGIGLDLALSRHGSLLFKNNAAPKAYISHPQRLSSQAKDLITGYMEDRFGGLMNAGKLGVLEEGMKIETLPVSNEDAQFLGSRQFSVQDICRWFKINPHLVGDPSRLAYASSEAEFNAYLVHSLAPWLRNIESEMGATLLGDDDGHLIEFDPNGMARGSQAERYESYSKGLAAGFLTVADVRAAENLPFLPGTDELRTEKSMKVRRIIRDENGHMAGIEEAS